MLEPKLLSDDALKRDAYNGCIVTRCKLIHKRKGECKIDCCIISANAAEVEKIYNISLIAYTVALLS